MAPKRRHNNMTTSMFDEKPPLTPTNEAEENLMMNVARDLNLLSNFLFMLISYL